MTDKTAMKEAQAGRLFYDDTCHFCRTWIHRLLPVLRRLAVTPVPFENGADEAEMRLDWHDGRHFGGADAAIFLASRFWWARPFAWLARAPSLNGLAHRGYRHIADNRHCRNGHCELPVGPADRPRSRPLPLVLGWLFTTLLVGLAIVIAASVFPGNEATDGWWTMWVVAVALWVGFKAIAAGRCVPRPSLAYLLWPGMDAAAFVKRRPSDGTPIARRAMLSAAAFLLGGLVLLGIAFPWATEAGHPLAAGWMGMMGLVACLHFGSFALLGMFWNRVGFPVTPLMNAPWRADSLANFWGDRWNRAFSLVARIAVFRPLVRRLGVPAGTLAGFLLSGVAHELVISLPARAGWGWPTLYFLVQGIGVLVERQ